MFKNLISSDSLLWISDQDFGNEILCDIRDIIPVWRWEIEFALLDGLKEFRVILFIEWREPTESNKYIQQRIM
jgi:hypothetical protein